MSAPSSLSSVLNEPSATSSNSLSCHCSAIIIYYDYLRFLSGPRLTKYLREQAARIWRTAPKDPPLSRTGTSLKAQPGPHALCDPHPGFPVPRPRGRAGKLLPLWVSSIPTVVILDSAPGWEPPHRPEKGEHALGLPLCSNIPAGPSGPCSWWNNGPSGAQVPPQLGTS